MKPLRITEDAREVAALLCEMIHSRKTRVFPREDVRRVYAIGYDEIRPGPPRRRRDTVGTDAAFVVGQGLSVLRSHGIVGREKTAGADLVRVLDVERLEQVADEEAPP